jgi:dihydroorotate dehydrogenase
MYKLLRRFLFLFDAEKVHYWAMNSFKILCRIPLAKNIISKICAPANSQAVRLFNLQFSNNIGLAAGFDKNALYLNELEALGFGHVEIGTVTPLPQDGNDKPRLFRLPKDKALINRMGFNNHGAEIIADRLKLFRKNYPQSKLIIGGNIGKNKLTPNAEAWLDYKKNFIALYNYVDYFVVNVSSPNTPGLRELQEKDSLKKIFEELQTERIKQIETKPLLLKIAPDLSTEQLDDVIQLALELKLDGLVISNTTISRQNLTTPLNQTEAIGAGGLSGMPVKKISDDVLKYVSQKLNGQIPIIASGGVFTKSDAQDKFDAGASLVQVWTGFIYEGPAIVKKII